MILARLLPTLLALALGAEPPPPAEPGTAAEPAPGAILSRALRTVPDDLVALTTAPFQDARTDGVVLGSLLALVAVDRPATRFLQAHVEPRLTYQWAGPFGAHGTDGYLALAVPAYYLGALALGDSKGQAAALLSVKAGAYAFLYAHLLGKSLTGRNRPNPDLPGGGPAPAPFTNDPWDWGHLHRPHPEAEPSGTAFPSYHYTLFFAVASVFHHVYDTPWIPYGAAAVVLGANFKGHRHWVSDCVAGAALGIGIGQVAVGRFNNAGRPGGRGLALSLLPVLDADGGCGLALRAAW
jgi:hypothetical protein